MGQPPGEAAPALELSGLTKTYRTGLVRGAPRPALRGLALTVLRGEILGYLGPNGSGKSTTLKIVLGLVRADAGSVRVLGYPGEARGWRARVGYLPEHPYFYDYLTAREYLDYAARLFSLPRARRRPRTQALLERLGLERVADVPLRRYSKGMLQRVGLAQALINDPEFVLLDEPMSGLDPLGRRMVRNLILDLKAAGKTVLFSTHILSDAESLCDRVALIAEGEVRRAGRLDEILALNATQMEVIGSGPLDLRGLPEGVGGHQQMGERWRLEVPERALADVIAHVQRQGGQILSAQPLRKSLEDYFLQEVGPRAAEAVEDLCRA
jgi:ABC-2 type transport system ATP-binding protein